MPKKSYYITTAIIYTSGKPHVGNMVDMVVADSLARFKKKEGYDVFFMTGTDEHGIKNEENAKKANLQPQAFVDKIAKQIQSLIDQLNVKYDKFIRTTDADHKLQVQKIFEKLYKQGDIYKGSYEGLYCTPCEAFWTPSQLVDGKCPDCGRDVHTAKEEAYFFKMSKYTDKLLAYYQENSGFFVPEARKNEMMNSFIKAGLQDLCVSRTSFTWGVPVPFDDKHVVYVWLDALSNYITGIGFDADGNHSETYKKFWPADVHVIGKDIVRFHTIYWPTILMALGQPLPKTVFGHPWLLMGGDKMSKSRGNVLYSDDMVNIFGADAVRYCILADMPLDYDGNITWESLTEKVNVDLANILGNLVSRTLSMTNQYFGGILTGSKQYESIDNEILNSAENLYLKVAEKMNAYKLSDALAEIFSLLRRCNKYIDETTPWLLAKEESKKDRLATVLYTLSNCILLSANLLQPFMPETAEKIALAFATPLTTFDKLTLPLVKANTKITSEQVHLFDRRNFKDIEPLIPTMPQASKTQTVVDSKTVVEKEEKANTVQTIELADFDKVALKTGKVVACEKVEKADKLLKLTVQIGQEERTIVSGIAKHYTAEELIGKTVVVITNLKPTKLRGILSEGMLLCGENADGKLSLVTCDRPIESGSVIR